MSAVTKRRKTESMASVENPITVAIRGAKLCDGVVSTDEAETMTADGCTAYTHYNGPTEQLAGVCAGMAVLEPGASPHPPHRHPEEEFLIVAEGTGEISCDGKVTKAGPGAMLYCAGNTLHGIVNTGATPLTFYWSKWIAKG
jgi:quercetin dioxygenase-like cupin family protein